MQPSRLIQPRRCGNCGDYSRQAGGACSTLSNYFDENNPGCFLHYYRTTEERTNALRASLGKAHIAKGQVTLKQVISSGRC